MNGATAPGRATRPVALEALRNRLQGGGAGALPVLLALLVIALVFGVQNPRFLSPVNITNLFLQVAAVGTIALGIYLVLLLGEIDLAVGSVSGVAGAVLAVTMVRQGWSPAPAVLSALAVGLAIGLLHGAVVTQFGVPSFVVTLAGLIGWQGLQLHLLGTTGTINLPQGFVTQLTSTFLPAWLGWGLAGGAAAAYVATQVVDRIARARAGLLTGTRPELVVRCALVVAGLLGATAVLTAARGVPLVAILLVGLVVVFDLLVRHTTFGRHLVSVGGNAEAARRAGIRVARTRVTVFAVAGLMAAAGGVLAASRLVSVNQASGSGDVLLNAIAAVVIGGTSLFGGRGSAWSALLGILVIGSISNGMDLVGLTSSTKFMITGAVLLVAVTVDAVSRRGREAAGRA
jgi:D-xylose transport system permease protein